MKKSKFILTFIIILSVVVVTACQVTPDEISVISKQSPLAGQSENVKSTDQNDESHPQFPTKWESELVNDTVGLIIDAQVDAPTLEKADVISATPDPITVQQLQSIVTTFFPNQDIYDKLAETTWTKADIQEQIVELTKTLNNPESLFNKDTSEQSKMEKQALLDYMKQLEQEYATAPEYVTRTPLVIGEEQLSTGGVYYTTEKGSGKAKGGIIIGSITEEGGKTGKVILQFPSEHQFQDESSAAEKLTITEADAKQVAEENLRKLGIDNMGLNAIYIEKISGNEMHTVIYTKKYGNLPETYTHANQFLAEMENYDFVWTNEYIKMQIDNNGVKLIEWNAPAKQGDIVRENVELLPFEKIIDSANRQLGYKEMWVDEQNGIIGRKIVIDKIRLGVMKVKTGNFSDNYAFVPVWDFFGSSTDRYSKQMAGDYELDENMEVHHNNPCLSYLTISAVDGTVIDRQKGY